LILALLICVVAAAQPRRIVSTAPSITETLFALGLGDRVVGVTTFCNYPPEAKKVTKIGSWMTPDLEAILGVRPDLVIVQRTSIHDSKRFTALNLKTLEVQNDSIANIYLTIGTIADVAGVPDRAKALVGSMQRQLEEVRKGVADRKPTTYLFIVGRTPGTLEGLIAVGSNAYLSEVFAIAGGRNILADSKVAYPKVLHEEILARDPEVILDMGDMSETSKVTEAHRRAVIRLWDRFPSLRAVKAVRVHAIASDIYFVPGPRVVDLAQELVRMLHPETFR
jgi:iron complex transport system substrate-binding protein